jgi:cytochrome c peroxidase
MDFMMSKFRCVFLISGLLLGACSENDEGSDSLFVEDMQVTRELRTKIIELSLTGDPSKNRDLPTVGSPLVTLGMQLFFTQALSGEMDVACVSCHHPRLGGGDNLALAIGVESAEPFLLGPGRKHASSGVGYDGGPTMPRNVPTIFNIGMWDSVIFNDGRIERVESTSGAGAAILTPDSANRETADLSATSLTNAQARFPATSPEEMKGHHKSGYNNAGIRDYLVARLRGDNNDLIKNEWLSAFQAGYQDSTGTPESLITQANVFNAVAEYERSQVFVDNQWKAFIEGERDAISLEAKKGAMLFYASKEQDGANCARCHSGDFFTDEKFHNLAIPQIGRGKGDGSTGTNDFGRFKVTKQEADRFAFRTPTLLNISVTKPYGHSGAYESLEGIVRHHLDVESAVYGYSLANNVSQLGVQSNDVTGNTQAAFEKLNADRTAGKPGLIENVSLSDEQVAQLVAFLNTLTDSCVAGTIDSACIDKWVPSDALADPDSLRVFALFQ